MLNVFFFWIVYIFYCTIPTTLNISTGFSGMSAGTTTTRLELERALDESIPVEKPKSTLRTWGLLLISCRMYTGAFFI